MEQDTQYLLERYRRLFDNDSDNKIFSNPETPELHNELRNKSEEELLRIFLDEKDSTVLGEIIGRYQNIITNIGYRIRKCGPNQAYGCLSLDDLVQEANLKIFSAMKEGKYNPERGKLSKFIGIVTKSAMISALRKERVRTSKNNSYSGKEDERNFLEQIPDDSLQHPDDVVFRGQIICLIRDEIERVLPERDQNLVFLKMGLDDFSSWSGKNWLGLTRNGAKSAWGYTLKKLRGSDKIRKLHQDSQD